MFFFLLFCVCFAFFFLNRTLFFLCFKIQVGFCEHLTDLTSSFRTSEFVFFEIKRFSEIAEIGVYILQLPEILKTRWAPHFKSHCNVYSLKTESSHRSTTVVTQSCNVLICLFFRVVVNVVVWLFYKRFVVKFRVARELVSQFYSDLKGSNPTSR